MRSTNLSVSLSDKPILENYSLAVERGGVLAILGANGVGKTTLLDSSSACGSRARGGCTISGRVGFVPQLFHSDFAYSVIDIVLMGRARHIGLFGSPRAEDYAVAQISRHHECGGAREHRAFNELSGGQRQLVMIAQALASDARS